MLKLSHRAYILIAVPLCFEIVFVAALINTQEKLNLAFQEQSKLTETLEIIGGILKDMPQGLMDSGLFQFSHNDRFSKEYDLTVMDIRSRLEKLKAMQNNDADPHLMLLSQSIDNALNKAEKTHVSFKSENQYLIMANLLRYKAVVDNIVKAADELALEQHRKIEIQKETEEKLRTTISIISIGGVSVSILLSLALALSFQRLLLRKIAVVNENGVKLAAGQPLLPRLSGDDELSRLDGSFHDMADALAYLRSKELAVIDNAVEIICSLDRKGLFTQINSAVTEILHYEVSDLIGASIFSIALTGADVIKEKMHSVVLTPKSKPVEISCKGKDGSVRDLQWSMTWNQKEETFFCVAYDVTERNRIDRLKRDMIAMVSHDLRSPLAALQASFELFGSGMMGALNDRGQQKINQGTGIIRRLITKINALLDIERLESGSMALAISDQSVEELIHRAVDSILSLSERKQLTLNVECKNIGTVACDPERLTDVLINLIHNAVKFAPKESTIDVSAIATLQGIEVCVKDQGKGVPESERELIFERFRQSASDSGEVQAQGSGLGLAIAKAVIVAHGGSMGVRANQPVGSIFWFAIPRTQQILPAGAEQRSRAISSL